MAKILLQDATNLRFSLEESSEGGKVVFKGEFARADVPTANRRVYPRKIWESNLRRLENEITECKVYGETDHPADGKTKLGRVSILLKKLELKEDGMVYGEAEVLDTPAGEILKAIRKAGGSIGVSSRGYGSVVQKEGFDVVQEDFNLMTFDCVSDPANGTSYPEFSVESKEVKKEEVKTESNSEKESDMDIDKKTDEVVAEVKPEEVKVDEVKPEEKKEEAPEAVKADDVKEEVKPEEVKKEEQEVKVEDPVKSDEVLPVSPSEEIKVENNDARYQEQLEQKDKEIAELNAIGKDLGYSLFVYRTLFGHPMIEQIVKQLDYSKFDSLESLESSLVPFKEEMGLILKQRQLESKIVREQRNNDVAVVEEQLHKALTDLEEEKKKNEDLVKSLKESNEKSEKLELSSYLDRQIVSNPCAIAIRKKFEESKLTDIKQVDRLIEENSTPSYNLFKNVRAKVSGKKVTDALLQEALDNTITKENKKEFQESNVSLNEDFNELGLDLKKVSKLSQLQ